MVLGALARVSMGQQCVGTPDVCTQLVTVLQCPLVGSRVEAWTSVARTRVVRRLLVVLSSLVRWLTRWGLAIQGRVVQVVLCIRPLEALSSVKMWLVVMATWCVVVSSRVGMSILVLLCVSSCLITGLTWLPKVSRVPLVVLVRGFLSVEISVVSVRLLLTWFEVLTVVCVIWLLDEAMVFATILSRDMVL